MGRFEIKYHPLVKKDIERLSSSVKNRVKTSIEKKLLQKPELYGLPLRQSLIGYRKLRVGVYRFIYRIDGNVIKILAIAHRSKSYILAGKRVEDLF